MKTYIPSKNRAHEYWVTNITQNRDVSIGDLRVTIRAGKSVNLLDSKHYSFTYEQLEKSRISGSIATKPNMIRVRDLPPVFAVTPGLHTAKAPRLPQVMRTTAVKVENKLYEELGDEIKETEEKEAIKTAEIIHNDNVPALSVDEKYKRPPEPIVIEKAESMDEYLLDNEE